MRSFHYSSNSFTVKPLVLFRFGFNGLKFLNNRSGYIYI